MINWLRWEYGYVGLCVKIVSIEGGIFLVIYKCFFEFDL